MQRVSLAAGTVVIVLVVIGLILAQRGRGFDTISAEEAHERLARDTTMVVLDVRREDEFSGETGHLPRAILIPFEDLERRVGELEPYKHRPLLVYCRSGRRSANASEFLSHQGFSPLNLDGGILRWSERGFPVIVERKEHP